MRKSYQLLKAGPVASMMYPHLARSKNGDIYAAWHSQDNNVPTLRRRRSIHVIKSTDGGTSWTKLDGTTSLTLPIVDDDTGPTDMVNDTDELDWSTPINGFLAKDGKLHFVYQSMMYVII